MVLALLLLAEFTSAAKIEAKGDEKAGWMSSFDGRNLKLLAGGRRMPAHQEWTDRRVESGKNNAQEIRRALVERLEGG